MVRIILLLVSTVVVVGSEPQSQVAAFFSNGSSVEVVGSEPPAQAVAFFSNGSSVEASKACTEPGSLSSPSTSPAHCVACRESSQCVDGQYCCPFMKVCIHSSSQSCYYPIGYCTPICVEEDCTSCKPTNGVEYGDAWAAPTCGSHNRPNPQPAPAPGPAPSPGPIHPGMKGVLDEHNIYRCMHDLEPLQWHAGIAENAQNWADQICDRMTHSSYTYRQNKAGFNYLGENLYWRSWSSDDWSGGVEAWYGEILLTDGGFVDSFKSGIGHYTQVVWKSTTHLGCGYCDGTLVCQYGPGGNINNQFATQVSGPEHTEIQCEEKPSPSPSPSPSPTPSPAPTPSRNYKRRKNCQKKKNWRHMTMSECKAYADEKGLSRKQPFSGSWQDGCAGCESDGDSVAFNTYSSPSCKYANWITVCAKKQGYYNETMGTSVQAPEESIFVAV